MNYCLVLEPKLKSIIFKLSRLYLYIPDRNIKKYQNKLMV